MTLFTLPQRIAGRCEGKYAASNIEYISFRNFKAVKAKYSLVSKGRDSNLGRKTYPTFLRHNHRNVLTYDIYFALCRQCGGMDRCWELFCKGLLRFGDSAAGERVLQGRLMVSPIPPQSYLIKSYLVLRKVIYLSPSLQPAHIQLHERVQ